MWIKQESSTFVCASNIFSNLLAQTELDFAKLTVTAQTAAKTGTSGYTIEFWVFANQYNSNGFNSGYDLKWEKQNRIKLYSSNTTFKAKCYPAWDTSISATANLNNEITITPNTKWEYIRCSTDITNKKYFFYSDDSTGKSPTDFTLATYPTIASTTTFSMSNNANNWGIIFFKQIHLWDCYDCIALNIYRL
ncbi:MAG: hypothetical protein GY861_10475 [bacterium]|nr:hypothetical protein [bacterium]